MNLCGCVSVSVCVCVCELTVVCLCEVFSPQNIYGTINGTAVPMLAFIGVTWLITLRGRKGSSTKGIRLFNLLRSRVQMKKYWKGICLPAPPPPSHAYDHHRAIWGNGGVAPLTRNLSTQLWEVTRSTFPPLYARTKTSVTPGLLKF